MEPMLIDTGNLLDILAAIVIAAVVFVVVAILISWNDVYGS